MRLGAFKSLIEAGPRAMLRAGHRALFTPRRGEVDFGDLRVTEPISRYFGFDRGTPIDRAYIEDFLARNRDAIRGTCLEVADATYTTRFGGDGVAHADVLHATGESSHATVVGDLTDLATVADETYDCVMLTQTVQFIYDFRAALRETARIMKPGASCLCTVSCISQISRFDMDRWGEFWRMTSLAAGEVFREAFPDGQVTVSAYGNVLAATAGLHGLAAEELTERELFHRDPDYEMVVCIRAVKGPRA